MKGRTQAGRGRGRRSRHNPFPFPHSSHAVCDWLKLYFTAVHKIRAHGAALCMVGMLFQQQNQ
jgi:hypothetical protein